MTSGALAGVPAAINLGGWIARLTGENFPPLWNPAAEANAPL